MLVGAAVGGATGQQDTVGAYHLRGWKGIINVWGKRNKNEVCHRNRNVS
jgi:hypothetical protein